MHQLEIIWCKHLRRKEIQHWPDFFKARRRQGRNEEVSGGKRRRRWGGGKHNILILFMCECLQNGALSSKDKLLLREMAEREREPLTPSSCYLWTKLDVCIFVGVNILQGCCFHQVKTRPNVPSASVCCLYVCSSSQLRSSGHIALMLWASRGIQQSIQSIMGGKLMKWVGF